MLAGRSNESFSKVAEVPGIGEAILLPVTDASSPPGGSANVPLMARTSRPSNTMGAIGSGRIKKLTMVATKTAKTRHPVVGTDSGAGMTQRHRPSKTLIASLM